MNRKALITGFDPFGHDKINPSWEAVSQLPDRIDDLQIVKLKLPTVFRDSLVLLENAIDKHNPSIVLSVGVAGGRSSISLERIAMNLDDARIPDNSGKSPIDEKIDPNGPDAYFSSLPIKGIIFELKKNLIPASVSNTAGTFVCNHVMYGLLNTLKKNNSSAKGGFVHIPYLPCQVTDRSQLPSMSLEIVVDALKIIIEVSSKLDRDIVLSAGKIH